MNDPYVDPRRHTFSQAQGFEPPPSRLGPGELPKQARNLLWAAFWLTTERFVTKEDGGLTWSSEPGWVVGPWKDVLLNLHLHIFGERIDDFSDELRDIRRRYKSYLLENTPVNKIFDLIQHTMRHPKCPDGFVTSVETVFRESQLAYFIDTNSPPTIFPAATAEEGDAIRMARRTLHSADQVAANNHLRRAAELFAEGKWRESVHQSMSAIESVATSVGIEGKTLGDVVKQLRNDKSWGIHGALVSTLDKLYGYASNRARHGEAEGDGQAQQEEAQLMIAACAAFCSYLLAKQRRMATKSGPTKGPEK